MAVLCFATGCASFSDRPPPPSYAGPEHPVAVQLQISEKGLLQIGRDDWKDKPLTGDLAQSAADAIRSSGWLRDPRDDDSGEMQLRVVSYQSMGPGLVPAATAFLIPGIIDHRIEVDVALSSPDGSTRECSRSIETRTWYQTLLIFVYPFRPPAYGRMKATEALALQCVSELLQRAGFGDGG